MQGSSEHDSILEVEADKSGIYFVVHGRRGSSRLRFRARNPDALVEEPYDVDVSKAFTKEDDAAGFSATLSTLSVPPGPFRITATGALEAAAHPDPRVHEALARAERLEPAVHPELAVLGVTVRVRNEDGEEKAYRLVPPEELALLGTSRHHHVASVESPVGRALLGARIGDVREVATPRGLEELEIVGLEGESSGPRA